ncbi:hypothetical protein ISCGN_027915 [Ixodes scapularis]
MYTDKEIEEELVTCSLLNKHFAERCTAHGFSRIASTGDNSLRRLIWIIIVIVAVGGFLYHISFLTSNYFSYPIMTATEEVHAEELHFPAITVCNLNIMRKSSFDDYLKDVAAKSGFPITTTTERPYGSLKTKTKDLFSPTTKVYSYDDDTEVCYKTVEEFLKTSRTMDLSDMWMNFIATKEHLVKFGHKANDLVVQCTYNARNCFDETHSILRVDPYPSPRYGLCQTIRLANDSMRKIRKTGPTLGLRLTLNIERSEYLDIISPEFGARLLIHPLGTAPTLERGGIILSPGSKSYISIRMNAPFILFLVFFCEKCPPHGESCASSSTFSRLDAGNTTCPQAITSCFSVTPAAAVERLFSGELPRLLVAPAATAGQLTLFDGLVDLASEFHDDWMLVSVSVKLFQLPVAPPATDGHSALSDDLVGLLRNPGDGLTSCVRRASAARDHTSGDCRALHVVWCS